MLKRLLSFLLALLFVCCAQTVKDKEEKNSSTAEMSVEGEVVERSTGKSFGDRVSVIDSLVKPEPDAVYDKSASSVAPARIHASSGLSAGYYDDNTDYNGYLNFLKLNASVPQIEFPVTERIILQIVNDKDEPLPDAVITVTSQEHELMKAKTYADGKTLVFPSEYPVDTFTVRVSYKGVTKDFSINRDAPRNLKLALPTARTVPKKIPVDILFVLDTTGSMSEEISRLKESILIINDNVNTLPVDVRFGMTAYRDRSDNYLTKVIPFTSDIAQFQRTISRIDAGGGGDEPEDMQKALEVSMKEQTWRENGARLVFLIADAYAHLDYDNESDLLTSSKSAREKGIKIFSVGTGGLDIRGEINLRQIAQYTMGKYLFLTYGERGNSEGGAPGSVSHHVGVNYTTDKLEAIIIRLAKEEISAYSMKPIDKEEDLFEAVKGDKESAAVLAELFSGMINSMISYSTVLIAKDTTVAVLPLSSSQDISKTAAYFTEHLNSQAALNKNFKAVERIDLEKILKEIKFNLSGLVTDESAINFGKLSGAEILITGSVVYKKDGDYEIYLKLLRAQTAEILSVTRAKAEKTLGIPE
jgi:hypothetical protein